MNPLLPRMPHRFPNIAGTLSFVLLLSACVSSRSIVPAAEPVQKITISEPGAVANVSDAWPMQDWWQAYGDPQLNQLIQHALAHNPTLANAQARIARAQAALDLGNATSGPQVTAAGDISYGRQSENYLVPRPPLGKGGEYVSQGQMTINFGQDLDLWGRNSALIRSAEAQLQAATHDRAAARLTLATSIARAYAQLGSQYEIQDILLATLEQRHAVRKLVEQRVAAGLDTRVEVKQADTNVAALRIEIEQLATAIKLTRLQLAALAGDMPTAADAISRPALAVPPFTIPRTLPLDLLGRRPELAALRSRITASVEEADAAKAQFYPNINLNALIGLQAIGLGQLLGSGSLMSSMGPAIRLPIFDAGRLRANHAARVSDLDAAVTQYNQSVLAATQDVAEQLTRTADLAREEKATRDALTAAEEAHRLAMMRYQGGLSPYLTVLTVEAQLLAQKRALAALQGRRADLQISLVRALGGGFIDEGSALSQAHAPQ